MPHDWVNVHVFDGDDEHDRTIVKQCARCRMLAIVGETAAASAVDYYPQHLRAPQDCTRGDMTEERASEIAALTEQRDLWARQCNLTSEREADLRNRVAELEAERDAAKANYYSLADAVCRESTSIEDACAQARATRNRLDRAMVVVNEAAKLWGVVQQYRNQDTRNMLALRDLRHHVLRHENNLYEAVYAYLAATPKDPK